MYQVNSEILAVWKKHENIDAPFMKRIPLFYTKPKTNCLLYVGFNPSFNEKFMSKLKAESVKSGKSYSFDYNTKTEFSEENINEVAEYEAGASIPGHEFFYEPYFKKLKKVSERIGFGDNFENIDLFFMRETNSKEVKKSINYGKDDKELNQFAEDQLAISEKIIKEAKPIVIIVINAASSNIYKNKFLCNQEKVDKKYGLYYHKIGERNVPTILCGMISGQRALDNFSLERMIWQINKYCK